MSDLEFDVAIRRAEPITFKVGGENALLAKADGDTPERRGKDDTEYVFTPPKSAVMLMPVLVDTDGNSGVNMTKSTFDWLGQGLPADQHERLVNRLKDPIDDLDVDTLSKIVEALSEKVAARPTT